jgi:glycine cleavage system H lipoate-binding protein
MTVLLVLMTFLVFVIIDFVLSRKAEPLAARPQPQPVMSGPGWMEGYLVPAHLEYHPGHTWLARERAHVERVGVDQFAAKLLGSPDSIRLPKPGHWIRQGQKAFEFTRDGQKTEMLSPVEGEVVEVNERVARDPSLLARDPYGEGWLLTVHAPDEESSRRNLLPKSLVPDWMRHAVKRLYSLQPQPAGATAADGGLPVEDPLSRLPGVSWEKTTREFFLTG